MRDSTSPASKSRRTLRAIAASIGIALFWLAIWTALYYLVGRDVIIPSPFSVGKEFASLFLGPDVWLVLGSSMLRVLLGILLAVVAGCAGGVLSACSPLFRRATRPLIAVIQATPVVSFIIIALIWFQSGHVAVVISFLMCLPVVWNNVATGIAQVDRTLLEMARVYRAPFRQMARRIYLPSVQPFFTAAMTTVLGLAWKVSVAAEVLSHPRYGIGSKLYDAKVYLETANLFAWTAVVVLLSIGFDRAYAYVLRRVAARRIVPQTQNAEQSVGADAVRTPHPAALRTLHPAAPPAPQLSLRELTFSYPSVEVLRAFSLTLAAGRIHCLFGPSGCGKTTLMRLIAGLESPQSGRIGYVSCDAQTEPAACDSPSVRGGVPERVAIGYVFQEDRLLPWCSVRCNLAFALSGHWAGRGRKSDGRRKPDGVSREGYTQDDVLRRVDAMMRTVKLSAFAGCRPDELSGGMRQRVNLARALLAEPTLLLMDEPFKGLEEALKYELMDYVKAYRSLRGATIVFTTHDRAEAEYWSDEIHRFEGPPMRVVATSSSVR